MGIRNDVITNAKHFGQWCFETEEGCFVLMTTEHYAKLKEETSQTKAKGEKWEN